MKLTHIALTLFAFTSAAASAATQVNTESRALTLEPETVVVANVKAKIQSVDKSKNLITFVNSESGDLQTLRYSSNLPEKNLRSGSRLVLELSAPKTSSI